MRRTAGLLISMTALAACASHVVYDKPGMNANEAMADWAACEGAALAATGGRAADAGRATVVGGQLRGTVVTPEKPSGGMYRPEDYASIKKRQQLRDDCLSARGYRFAGSPATEWF